jgi:hypothetical protein
LPEVIRALEAHQTIISTGKWQTSLAALGRWGRSVVEGDFKESYLDDNHQQRLKE